MPYDLTTRAGLDKRVYKARKRAQKLHEQFSNFRIYCQEVAEFFWPERANFTIDRTPGVDLQTGLYTGAPQMLRRDLGNKIGTMTRPPSDEWFRLVARPEEMMSGDDIRYWCDIVTRQQRRIIYDRNANFTSCFALADQDYVCFGNSVSWCAYNRMQTGLIFRDAHLRDCSWAVNEENMVDELYQRMKLPLGQVVRLFGEDKLPREWKKRYEKADGRFEEVELIRGAVPVDMEEYERGSRPPARMKYSILYFVQDCDKDEHGALGEAFCEQFPYLVRRWMPMGESFGRSLCTNVALADARTLNIADMAALKAIEMLADPPRWAEDEAVLGAVDLVPGGVTFVDTSRMTNTRDPIGKIEGGDPRSVMEFMMYKRNSMATQFFETLWKFPDRQMTAFETGERMEIMTQEATPVFQPIEADNARLMDLVFSKASAKNAYPPPPPRLLNEGEAEWEFETPVTRSLRKARAYKAKQIIETLAIGKQVIPELGNQLNVVEMEREMLAGMGPENWIKPRDVAAQDEAMKQESMIEDQQDQDAMAAAQIAAGAKPENLRMIEEAVRGQPA